MSAGRLDRRIVIQSNSATRDSYGQPIPSWSTFDTVWAGRTPDRVMEQFRAGQELASAVVGFRIRFRNDIDQKMRIKETVFTSPLTYKYYDVLGFKEVGRSYMLDIIAKVIESDSSASDIQG